MNETKKSPTMGYGWAATDKDQEFFHPSETRAPIERLVARFGGRCVELVERVEDPRPGVTSFEAGGPLHQRGALWYDAAPYIRKLEAQVEALTENARKDRDRALEAESDLELLSDKHKADLERLKALELRVGHLRTSLKVTCGAFANAKHSAETALARANQAILGDDADGRKADAEAAKGSST